MNRATLQMMLREHAYKYRAEPYTLKSGIKTNHYVDCRPVLMHPEGAEVAALLIRSYIKLHVAELDAIAGIALGGIALVDEICSQEYVETDNIFYKAYVRTEPKEHGTKNQLEMDFGLAQMVKHAKTIHRRPKVLLVDDVWTTGDSVVRAKAVLAAHECEVVGTAVVVDRMVEGTPRPDFALFTLADILRVQP